MSCWYSIDGGMMVRDTEESRIILERFNDECGDLQAETLAIENGVRHISIGGGGSMSYGTAEELDDILRELGSHVVSGVLLNTVCDDDHSTLYIGTPDGEAKAVSDDALEKIRELLPSLTADGLDALDAMILEATSNLLTKL